VLADYVQVLGARLRDVRQREGLSLQRVEQRSGGRWKAVVVGSYERGDRAVTDAGRSCRPPRENGHRARPRSGTPQSRTRASPHPRPGSRRLSTPFLKRTRGDLHRRFPTTRCCSCVVPFTEEPFPEASQPVPLADEWTGGGRHACISSRSRTGPTGFPMADGEPGGGARLQRRYKETWWPQLIRTQLASIRIVIQCLIAV